MKYNSIYECIKYCQENPAYNNMDIIFMFPREIELLEKCIEMKYLLRKKQLCYTEITVTDEGINQMKQYEQFIKKIEIETEIKSDRHKLKDSVFMNMALENARLGTCNRLKVGCILLREDGSLASGGYNGSLSGMRHCEPETCNCDSRCLHTAHAEENALFFSSGNVYKAYVTHEPCLVCTRMLVRRGVREVIYNKPYSSISDQERSERQEIIDHFELIWRQYGENHS